MPKLKVAMKEISSYPQLLSGIRQQIQQGILQVKKQLERQRIMTYWEVGQTINNFMLIQPPLANAEVFYEQLAEDLQQEKFLFKRVHQFYQAYPRLKPRAGLTWTHYRILTTIPDERIRQEWESRVIHEKLPSDTLYALIREDYIKLKRPALPAPVERVAGVLYTYQLADRGSIPWPEGCVVLDLGFNMRHAVVTLTKAKLAPSEVVRSEETKEGYRLKRVQIKKEKLFTYRARLERVVDGDTLLINIDCGFHIWRREYVRLARLNCPEINTKEGRRVQNFVTAALKEGDFFVVKTYRSDKYGRYLADVFYLPNQAALDDILIHGVCLNQQLLDKEFALPV